VIDLDVTEYFRFILRCKWNKPAGEQKERKKEREKRKRNPNKEGI